MLIIAMLTSTIGCGGLRIAETLRMNPSYLPAVQRLDSLALVSPTPVAPPLTLVWQQDVYAGIGGEAPVSLDSILLLGNQRGELLGIHLRDGQRVGSASLGNAIHARPALAGGVAYVPISGSRESLIAYDVLEGRTVWKQQLGDLQVSPLLLNGKIFIGNTGGSFSCVNAATGDVEWKFELPENARLKGIRSAAAGDSMAVFFGGEDAAVYALDPVRGRPLWRRGVDAAIQTPVVIHDSLILTATLRGTVYAIDRGTGNIQWSARTDAPVYGRLAVTENLTIAGSTNGGVYAFATRNGKLVWKHIAAGPISAGVAVSGSYVYFGTLKKEILALDMQTGTVVWRSMVAGRIKTAPIATNEMVVFSTDEPAVMAFRGTQR